MRDGMGRMDRGRRGAAWRSAGVYTLLGCTAAKGVGGATRKDNGVSVSVISANASVSTYSL